MADQENDPGIPTGAEHQEDTRTRKTVRLKPTTVAPSSIKMPDAAPIADPLAGRDTDTGNLEILEDTKTRRTVKLKPLAPQTQTASVPIKLQVTPTAAPAADAETDASKKTVVLPAADTENTQTRKTVLLRPSITPSPAGAMPRPAAPAAPPAAVAPAPVAPAAPAAPVAPAPAAAPAAAPAEPAPAAPAADGDDTQTRKTVSLRPSAVTPAGMKVEAQDDQTMKLQRPVRPGAPQGIIPPKTTVEMPAANLVKESDVKTTMEMDSADLVDEKATVKLTPPKLTPPQLARPGVPPAAKKEPPKFGVPAAAPAAAPVTEEEAPAAEEAADGKKKKKEKKVKAPVEFDGSAPRPSLLYLIVAVLTLLGVVFTTALATVQYLNFEQKQNIELPMLGNGKAGIK